MSLLSMVEANLPPGFRFHPRDDELICDYLSPKIAAAGDYGCPMLIAVDLNKCEPWDLPEMACVGDKEWYFFSLRDRKYATGQRTNRATLSGYWKATGKDRQVVRKAELVGMRKTLVFYQGRAPKGKKTDWVMHEFRMEGPHELSNFSHTEDWVLSRVFYKSRGISSKPSTETCYDDTGSSSLPPLTNTYIAFDQTPLNNIQGFEQVPCFSSFPPNLLTLRPNPAAPPPYTHLAGLSNLGSNSLTTIPCEDKVIKAVLSQLTKLEGSHNRKDVAPNLQSYLTDTDLNSIWYPFQC